MADQASPLFLALRQALRADTALAAAVTGVFDHVPAGQRFPYVVLADHQTVAERGQCWDAAEHFIDVHVWSRPKDRGSKECRTICGLVWAAAEAAALDLGATVALARLQFRDQRVMRDPFDAQTWHGVVTLEAETEEV